jgi:hypothetical protein
VENVAPNSFIFPLIFGCFWFRLRLHLETPLEPEKQLASRAKKPLWPLFLLGILVASYVKSTFMKSKQHPITEKRPSDDRSVASTNDSQPSPQLTPADHVSPVQTPSPQCGYQITCKTEKDLRDKVQFWVGLVGLIFLIAYTITTIIYACITHRQWQEMQTQTAIQQKAAINAERAWVGLDGQITIDLLEISPRLKVESHYTVKNFGHGPALKVFASGIFLDTPKLYENVAKNACTGPIEFATGTVPTVPRIRNPGPMGYILFNNQTHTETMGSERDPWQGAGEANLKHFWFIGCIAYVDQFRIVHWTRFCMEPSFFQQPINKDTPLQFCALYNDTGDGEPK